MSPRRDAMVADHHRAFFSTRRAHAPDATATRTAAVRRCAERCALAGDQVGQAVGKGAVRAFQLVRGRWERAYMGAVVLDALRGEPPPEDPSASPSRRLEAQMRAGDGTVSRSPEQLRASSSKLEAEGRGCVDDAEVIIAKRGAGLIDKYGLRRAAGRIADITGASVVSIVRTLEAESGLSG